MSDTTDLAVRTLQHLETRRCLLERLIVIAHSLEVLKHSLESLIDPLDDSEPPPDVAATFAALDHKLRNMADAEVSLRLKNLDSQLKLQFQQLQPLLEQLENDDSDHETLLMQARDLIERFHRYAKTALALRLLLRCRGLAVEDLQLPYQRRDLLRQIRGLASQEQVVRRQVIDQMQAMAEDLDGLLASPALHPALRAQLGELRAGLDENLAHLLAGHSIEDLPLAVEPIDFDAAQVFIQQPLESAPQPPSAPLDTAGPGAYGAARASQSVQAAAPSGGHPRGFWRGLWLWLTTPFGVTWKEIRKGKKPD
ncbi:MAG: hypothetical protein V4812_22590 [Pseudomonadota bacterium]